MPQSIVIRDIVSPAEMRLVEDLQKVVWGIPAIEVVPVSQMVAAVHTGGVLVGAFAGDALAGFAYGFVAKEDEIIAHHSHMVGVRKEFRSQDLGFRLKAEQRQRVLGQGIKLMSWTFDPLQSPNAHFNFRKLGVIAKKYFIDFYGTEAGSFLHQNGTDRLWVTWELTSRRVTERMVKEAKSHTAVETLTLVECGDSHRPILQGLEIGSAVDHVAIEIPTDISSIESSDKLLAAEWRRTTREAFVAALTDGFFVEDFYRVDRFRSSVGIYHLKRLESI